MTPARRRALLQASAILAVTMLAYIPAMRSGFIWDDQNFLYQNPRVLAADGLYRFWFTKEAPDYFPLSSTTMWIEWRLFGMNPAGYHIINVLLHALSSVLLWRVLERLRIPGAWLAALAFALHPVCVESAAWITERKNTLPMVFYWLTILLYLRFEERRRAGDYLLALGAFLLALLAKTSVVMLPLVLLLLAWWQRRRIGRRDLALGAPFFVLSLVLGLVTVWFQYDNAIGLDVVREDSLASRLALAGRAFWFYLGKTLWPVHLCYVYPRWEVDALNPVSYVAVAAMVLLFVLLWRHKDGLGRPCLAGLGFFLLNLLPVIGLLDIYYMRYSLVADHWQYFSIAGVVALVIGLGAHACRANERLRRAAPLLGGAMVLTLSVLTWRQQAGFHDLETLWRHAIACNPGAFLAHQNLGFVHESKGDFAEAARCYAEALRVKPDFAEAHSSLGAMLAQGGQLDAAIAHVREAIRLKPRYADAQTNLGVLLFERGETEEALLHLAFAVELDDRSSVRRRYLGQALAKLGRDDEALPNFRAAVRLDPRDLNARLALGSALLKDGAIEPAIEEFRAILQVDPRHAAAAAQLNAALAARESRP